jgi:hypothetical protein
MNSWWQQNWSRLMGLLVVGVFLGAFLLSLFSMSLSMSANGLMSGCPFMAEEEVLCSMSVFEHISAWESSFLAVVPLLSLVFVLSSAIIFVLINTVRDRFCYIRRVVSRFLDRKEKIYTFSYRQYQELFAQGILHAKLFRA